MINFLVIVVMPRSQATYLKFDSLHLEMLIVYIFFIRTILQEILDQIVHVDLVVNFKCSEENLVKKNLGTGKFTRCQEYLRMGSCRTAAKQLQDEQSESHCGSSWKENVRSLGEQVTIIFLSRGCTSREL